MSDPLKELPKALTGCGAGMAGLGCLLICVGVLLPAFLFVVALIAGAASNP